MAEELRKIGNAFNMEELLNSGIQVNSVIRNAYGEIFLIEHGLHRSVLISAIAPYIPIQEFRQLFSNVGDVIKANHISRLIFDKRNLNVFHQPSMEWYFVQWKEEMMEYGLITHIKILPVDHVFRTSVRIGREKIEAAYPHARYHELSIHYSESLLEAVHYGL